MDEVDELVLLVLETENDLKDSEYLRNLFDLANGLTWTNLWNWCS